MAMDMIYFEAPDEWEESLFDSTEYAMELDKRNPVLEGIIGRLRKLGFPATEDDKKGIERELNIRYKKIGIADGIPKALKNWIEKGTPVNPAYRENLYNLCLALEMNLDEIRIFFLKSYMTIPFNYKNRIDAIYYYGILHDLPYIEIANIIKDLSNDDESEVSSDDNTAYLGHYIAQIDDIEVFKEFIRHHSYNKKQQYNTAAIEIEKLAYANAEYADIERNLKDELKREIRHKTEINGNLEDDIKKYDESSILRQDGTVKYKALLFVIYGYDSQERYVDKKNNISKSKYLPKLFRENFPNDQEFSRIASREASPEVYRKALIIMNFYNFYCSKWVYNIYGTYKPSKLARIIHNMGEWEERDFYDFYEGTSELLVKCGFEQMYARNPFDWLILYCAKSTNPMDVFRELLSNRYTNYEE